MLRCYGVDAGYGWTKLVGKGKRFKTVSIIGASRQRNLSTKKDGLLENIHIGISGKDINGDFFIGELAEKESLDAGLVLDVEKIEVSKILVLTALALATAEEGGADISLVTGLPIAHYYNQKEKLENTLIGKFTVEFKEGIFENSRVFLNLRKVTIVPQGAGAIFSQVFDANGVAYPNEITNKRVACIDVGYKTTDFLVMDKLSYIDQLSSSLPIGVVNAHSAYMKRMAEKGKEMLIADVMNVQKEEMEPELKSIAERITRNTRPYINEDTPVLLAGGGVQLFGSYLRGNVIPNAQYANAEGYYRIALAWRNEANEN